MNSALKKYSAPAKVSRSSSSRQNEVADKPVVTFSCNEHQLSEEIIALKTLVFSLLRNLPHETAIETIRNLKGNSQNPVLNGLCTEMVDAMIATTSVVEEN